MHSNHLRALTVRPIPAGQQARFPFNIPAIRGNTEIAFDTAVTFLVGENGSGKSTLLEALATAVGAYTVGAEELGRDQTLAHAQELAGYLKLVWTIKTRQGFFCGRRIFLVTSNGWRRWKRSYWQNCVGWIKSTLAVRHTPRG
ncbi:MAG: AAA family ATPase [Anaerolineae bacterium]|nr:AAA family ATPase [Anaerolineae bacterium]